MWAQGQRRAVVPEVPKDASESVLMNMTWAPGKSTCSPRVRASSATASSVFLLPRRAGCQLLISYSTVYLPIVLI